jgi:hypothetical protein
MSDIYVCALGTNSCGELTVYSCRQSAMPLGFYQTEASDEAGILFSWCLDVIIFVQCTKFQLVGCHLFSSLTILQYIHCVLCVI